MSIITFRSIVDNGHKFEARVIPESLRDVVLHLGHNQSGHNGYQRTYAAIVFFANLFVATTGTNTRNATFTSVHSALL